MNNFDNIKSNFLTLKLIIREQSMINVLLYLKIFIVNHDLFSIKIAFMQNLLLFIFILC